eukprot:10891465-Heterocapsa_arctica.AAC.1
MAETPTQDDVTDLPSKNDVDEPTPMDALNVTNGAHKWIMVDAPNDPNDDGLWWSNGLQRHVPEDEDPANQCKRNAAGASHWGAKCSFVHDPKVEGTKKLTDPWQSLIVKVEDRVTKDDPVAGSDPDATSSYIPREFWPREEPKVPQTEMQLLRENNALLAKMLNEANKRLNNPNYTDSESEDESAPNSLAIYRGQPMMLVQAQ